MLINNKIYLLLFMYANLNILSKRVALDNDIRTKILLIFRISIVYLHLHILGK
jgi:hypothetical protein